ncbi:uncharacterized protein LOC136027540 [Artemia franciscana]|uniref:Uncharacterized protein n=1 Tax=Artemia franciscana TaxID=6661 RepID=A0AA88L6I9_ARTSF|nr:hypothetical protein QYM36_013465 [Artemia franciscana]
MKDLGFLVLGHISVTEELTLALNQTLSENYNHLKTLVEVVEPNDKLEDIVSEFLPNSLENGLIICINLRDPKWEKILRDNLAVISRLRVMCFLMLMGSSLTDNEFADECQKIGEMKTSSRVLKIFSLTPMELKSCLKEKASALITATRAANGSTQLTSFML